MAAVSLENVSRAYPGGVLAVEGVSLEVVDREFLVLVGPSGCGKTTTLRLIAGLEELTSGKISIAGRLVNDVAAKHRDIAMVFQNYALYPHMTVYRNMAFGLELREGVGGIGRLWRWALATEKKRRWRKGGIRLPSACARRPVFWASNRCWSAIRGNCRAASGNGWRSGEQSSATRPCFCSTSRCRIWMQSCGWKCGAS